MMKIKLLLLSLLLSLGFLQAQKTTVSGKILDSKTLKPVKQVSIYLNDSDSAVISKEATFSIASDQPIYKLRFEKDNYELKSININQANTSSLTISLNPDAVKSIEGVVITTKLKKYKSKKENPAYTILKEVWKKKKNNALDKYKTYTFDEYEKIEFDLSNIDSTFTKKKIFNKIDFIFNYADSASNGKLALPIFLNEAFYKNYGRNQPAHQQKKDLIAQKTSGFQNNEIVSLTAKNLYKEINIYDNTINFFNIGFQSPVSTDGFSTYNYNLLDSSSTVNGEECYRIQYEPKRKDVLAFQGYLYISKDSFAVVKATMRNTHKMNVNFVNGLYTELEFNNPDEETFLPSRTYAEFDLSLLNKNREAKGIIAKRTVSYTHYEFDQPIADSIFKINEEDKDSQKLAKNQEYWNEIRTDSLSKSEEGIYDMLDQLNQVPKFTRMVKLWETAASGYYNVGNAVDIGDLYSTFGFNDVEGTRIRMGARTFFSRNDDWRIQGYAAYGFKDQQFKYGAEAKYMFSKNSRFMVGIGTRRDIMQLGVQLTTDDGIMSRSFASSSLFARGDNGMLSSVNQTNFFTSIEPWKNFQLRLDGTVQSIKSANPDYFNLMYYRNGKLRQTTNDTHFTFSMIARPGAKFSTNGVDRYEHTTLSPTLVLKYTRGINNLFGADFGYNKLQFMYTQPILLRTWGKSVVNLEAGKNFDTVPLALQNVIPGNQSYSLAANTFSQLNYYEFVADTYATFHLEHHFNGKILSYIPLIKKLKLREVGIFRAAYGNLSDASKNINAENNRYSAPDQQIYYEYGFGIENIGFGNFRILRVDFNWRGNYLNRPDISKFGVKAGFQFSF